MFVLRKFSNGVTPSPLVRESPVNTACGVIAGEYVNPKFTPRAAIRFFVSPLAAAASDAESAVLQNVARYTLPVMYVW